MNHLNNACKRPFWQIITFAFFFILLLGWLLLNTVAATAAPLSKIIGETGRVNVTTSWQTVNLTNSYTDPVVVAFINSRNGDESVDVRVRNVTGNSFQIFMEEPDNGGHLAETASYIVMEKGRYLLEGNLVVEAGAIDTASMHIGGNPYGGDLVTFSHPFITPPAVLHTLNSYANGDFMSSAVYAVTTTSFTTQQETAESGKFQLGETIAWIAFAPGSGTTNGFAYEIGSASDGSHDGVDDTPHTITFSSFATTPDVVVKINITSTGTDGVWSRGAGTFNNNSLTVYAEEDQVGDTERTHADETFAWAAFETNAILVASRCFVETTGDNIIDYDSPDATAVQTAVNAATAGDTLKIAGTCTGVNNQGGDDQTVYIDKDLSLVGGYDVTNWLATPDPDTNPTTLDAEGNGRVMRINNANVTLTNLTLTNGDFSNVGGGIFTTGGLTLNNSVVTDNHSDSVGGGIYTLGTTFLLQNSVIENNQSDDSSLGGGGLFLESTVTDAQIMNSTIRNNHAVAGGGLYNHATMTTIENSAIYSNTATSGNGGGVYNSYSTNGLTLLNSSISQNTGSGLTHAHESGVPLITLNISYTTIAYNSAEGLQITAVNPARNTTTIASSLIVNNGVDCANPHSATLDTTRGYNLDSDGNCVTDGVDNNITSATPSVAFMQDNGGETWTNGLQAGSLALDQIPYGVNGCATTILGDQRGVGRSQLSACDIGAFEKEGVVTVACNTAALITAVSNASTLGSYAEINLAADCVYLLTAVNTTDPDGYGPIGLPTIRGTATINGNGATIMRDDAATPFRLFYVADSGDLTLNQITLQNGYALGGDGGDVGAPGGRGGGAAGLGGAIFNKGTLMLSQSTLLENAATGGNGGATGESSPFGSGGGGMGGNARGSGGGGVNGGKTNQPGGEGGGGGGGIFASNGGNGGFGGGGGSNKFDTFGHAGSRGSGGFAGGDGGVGSTAQTGAGGGGAGMGGAIFNYNGIVTIENSTLTSNTVQGGSSGPGRGGEDGFGYGAGIFNNDGTVMLIHTTIAGNTATGLSASNGGGIYNYSAGANLTLINSIVADSTDNKTDCINNSGTVTVTDSIVESHTSCGTPTEVDPQLGTLADFGGATDTMPLLMGSPALNMAAGCNGVAVDQRGVKRPFGGACDMGAYEALLACNVTANASYSFEDVGISIQSAGLGDINCLQVIPYARNHPDATSGIQTGMYWTINALNNGGSEASGYTIDLTLPYANADENSRACRWLEGVGAGAGWDCTDTDGADTSFVANTSVTRLNVMNFSDWAVGDDVGPTAVSLQSFSADTNKGGWVWLLLLGTAVMLTIITQRFSNSQFRLETADESAPTCNL